MHPHKSNSLFMHTLYTKLLPKKAGGQPYPKHCSWAKQRPHEDILLSLVFQPAIWYTLYRCVYMSYIDYSMPP